MPSPAASPTPRGGVHLVGDVRIIAVDGLSGAGKSTLAQSLAALLHASIIHLDDVYRGWGGLGEVGLHLRDWVIRPLAEGRDPRWHPWDWLADAPSEDWLQIPRSEFLVVEGCGSGAAEIETATALVVWVEAPQRELDTRLRGRPDWPWYEAHLTQWRAQEVAVHTRNATRKRADVIVSNGDEPRTIFGAAHPPTRPR